MDTSAYVDPHDNKMDTLYLDGQTLTPAQVVAISRNWGKPDCLRVQLTPESRKRIASVRGYIEKEWLTSDAPTVYGFNTGVGKLKNCKIPLAALPLFQSMLVNAHAAGVGDPLSEDVVRATMLLRINAQALGHSGARIELVDRLIEILNHGIHPVVPAKGSVGASGDLAPLAYIAAAAMGHDRCEVFFHGKRMPARSALHEAGLPVHFELQAKETLSILNGSTVSLAIAVLAADDARNCLKHADIALAMSLEAMRGEVGAFDERLHRARPHAGQIECAFNVRQIIRGSERCSSAARRVVLADEAHFTDRSPERVQDAYSIRCAPQVHGPARDSLRYVDKILSTEINGATDNPLLFWDSSGSSITAISGGNFHGQYIAQAMDLLSIAMTDIGSISERRSARLIDPTMSFGLPPNLTARDPGVNTGYSIVHCTLSALVTENKTLSWPASVDSIPTKSNQEDHVSNSTWAARKAQQVTENVEQIIAGELLLAAQALTLVEPYLQQFQLGVGTRAAYASIRERIAAALDGDRWMHDDIRDIRMLLKNGTISRAVEDAVGQLAFGNSYDRM